MAIAPALKVLMAEKAEKQHAPAEDGFLQFLRREAKVARENLAMVEAELKVAKAVANLNKGKTECSPREHVAALIEAAGAKGWNGEQILQLMEKFVTGYDADGKRIRFFYSGPVQIETAD